MKLPSRLQTLVVLAVITVCTSCMTVSDSEDARAPERNESTEPNTPFVRALPEPHHYAVVFPAGAQQNLLIERDAASTKEGEPQVKTTTTHLLNVQDGRAEDAEIQDGMTYTYRWGSAQGSQVTIAGQVTLKIPRDIVIDGDMSPKTPEVAPLFAKTAASDLFGRLIFRQHGTLTMEGHDLKVRFARIDSDDGTLRTFAPDATATELGSAGRSGGRVLLEAGVAMGNLRIEMRGEAGAQGKTGPGPDAKLVGQAGANVSVPPNPGSPFCSDPMFCVPNLKTCLGVVGLPGQDGFVGQRGYQGLRGGPGGDAGTFEIRVTDATYFRPSIKQFPGAGGAGGLGGDGGSGGSGGNTGTPPPGECFGPAGHTGPRGPRGEVGPRGDDGHEGSVCVRRGVSPDCTAN